MGDLNPIQLSLGVPPVAPGGAAWGDLLRLLEARFPGVELAWRAERIQGTGGGAGVRRVRLDDREGWVRAQLGQGQGAQLFSGPEQLAVSVSLAAPVTITQDGSAVGRIDVWLHDEALPTSDLPGLLAAVAGAAKAFHASYTPLPAATLLTQLLYADRLWPNTPAAQLVASTPVLAQLPTLSPRGDRLVTAAAPAQIGWTNYWSAATAEHLEVRPAVEEAFWRCEQDPAGGWLATLTADPLDVRRPEHAAALVEAYRRLPAVGSRLPGARSI